MIEQGVSAPDLIALAEAVARGHFATAQGHYDEAIDLYRKALVIEGRLPYQEPPYWYYPVNQSLGAALLLAGPPSEASEAFHAALVQAPNCTAWPAARRRRGTRSKPPRHSRPSARPGGASRVGSAWNAFERAAAISDMSG